VLDPGSNTRIGTIVVTDNCSALSCLLSRKFCGHYRPCPQLASAISHLSHTGWQSALKYHSV
jgi:hypothetical protein